MIQIGNHRDQPSLYVPIQQAQEQLAEEELASNHDGVILVSSSFKLFAERGLMKDEFHYTQEGYDLVGTEAGVNAGRKLAVPRR